VTVIARTFGCNFGYDKDLAMTDDHDNVIRFPHCAWRVDDIDGQLAKLEALIGTTRMRYYKLDGHIPVRVETLKAWADEVAQHDRITALTGIDPWRVDVTKIDDVVISTVFLGLDYRMSRRGPPLLFETKVFGGSRPFPEPLRDMGQGRGDARGGRSVGARRTCAEVALTGRLCSRAARWPVNNLFLSSK
jgi:hypothetical protein